MDKTLSLAAERERLSLCLCQALGRLSLFHAAAPDDSNSCTELRCGSHAGGLELAQLLVPLLNRLSVARIGGGEAFDDCSGSADCGGVGTASSVQ